MWFALTSLIPFILGAAAVEIDITDRQSIYAAQALIAKGLMDYYNGNDSGQTPGMFTQPYYWWEAGAAWGSLLDYTYYTGNDTYADLVKTSLLYQIGKDWNYMPANQTSTEGNDDQGFWGLATMAAAEFNFSNPEGGYPSWLYLTQAVFNTMAARWETGSCNGGLRWQIYTWNAGYSYKNSVSNGCMFNLASRLARYTANDSYVDWAEKIWDWEVSVQFLNYTYGAQSLSVFDGADMNVNCTDVRQLEWTYNQGLFMSGAAYLYNYTEDQKWLTRVEHLWNRATILFHDGTVMYEAACQPSNRCNTDQRSFKGLFSRFLGRTMLMAPEMFDKIMPKIQSSAMAAAQSCSGGTDGHTCGLNWFYDGWDGVYGLGEQICGLEVMTALLIHDQGPPLTEKTGASSKGDGAAGTNHSDDDSVSDPLTIEGKDRAGAGVLTAVVVIVLLAASWWLVI
uniref:Mannan endo-1,6-alpha-mannosidase n=1 Tax=Blastobotrys adeninivorans TaxID=409370 RepID=A0A060T2P9_BLAAD